MTAERIIVINPNSTEEVTRGIDRALDPLRMAGGPDIECVTLPEGPPGIETQADVENVVAPLCNLVKSRDNDAAAFVIACYSDPGLHAAREITARPVLGIAECAMLTALTKGERFGLISILESGVQRHLRYVRQLGLTERFAGDVPVGMGVTELADEAKVLRRMIETGEYLRDEHGADVLIFGCAGMADYRDQVAECVGMPVVEPSQAAVTMAIGAVRCRMESEP
jgi:allantoin racemase